MKPDEATYVAIVNCYSQIDDSEVVLQIIDQVDEDGLKHDVIIYTILINAILVSSHFAMRTFEIFKPTLKASHKCEALF